MTFHKEREFLEVFRTFNEQLFGQLLFDRRRAAAFEIEEPAKRVLRAFLPIRRFRPFAASRNSSPIAPALFVTVGRLD